MPIDFKDFTPLNIPPEKIDSANLILQIHILAELRTMRSLLSSSIALREKQDVAKFEKLSNEQVESSYNHIVAHLYQKFGE